MILRKMAEKMNKLEDLNKRVGTNKAVTSISQNKKTSEVTPSVRVCVRVFKKKRITLSELQIVLAFGTWLSRPRKNFY